MIYNFLSIFSNSKKQIFGILIITLILVLSLTFCKNHIDLDIEDEHFTEDGRQLILLTINEETNSRALSLFLAQNGSNFYEVTFRNGDTGEIFRTSWNFTQTGRIRVTPGNYGTGEGKNKNGGAVLFAGTASERILLAIGTLSSSEGYIDRNINSVTFLMQPLTNSITAAPANDSSFKITESGYETAPLGSIPTVEISGVNYPVYDIPIGEASVTAEYTFGLGTPTTPFNIIQENDTNLIQILEAKIDSAGILGLPGYNPLELQNISITPNGPSANFPLDGKFNLEIKTDTVSPLSLPYLSRISVKIKVNAIDTSDASNLLVHTIPFDWYIQGGIRSESLDAGTAVNSQGGAVILRLP